MAHVPPHLARLAGAPAARPRPTGRRRRSRLSEWLAAARRAASGYAEAPDRRPAGDVAEGKESLRVPSPRVASDPADRPRSARR
jgi:hypothetical protein